MIERIRHPNGIVTYRSPLLHNLGVAHAFSTRIGGISEGPYASLNLGSLAKASAPDHNVHVSENFRRLRAALGCERLPRVEAKQVHGCDVWIAPASPVRPNDAPCADAIVSDRPDRMLTVRTADCVPVLLADETGRHVAAVHAGWRGLVAGTIVQTLQTLAGQFNTPAAKLVAAIGPCISAERFEIGEEVAEAFEQAQLAEAIVRVLGHKAHIDLRLAAREQLLRAGVLPHRIDTTDRCTHRDADEFFSHRRDRGITGRHAAVIIARA